MTKLQVDIPVLAKAYWPGLQALIGRELRKAIESDVRKLADNYYSQVVSKIGHGFIEKAEYIDGKLIVTIKP